MKTSTPLDHYSRLGSSPEKEKEKEKEERVCVGNVKSRNKNSLTLSLTTRRPRLLPHSFPRPETLKIRPQYQTIVLEARAPHRSQEIVTVQDIAFGFRLGCRGCNKISMKSVSLLLTGLCRVGAGKGNGFGLECERRESTPSLVRNLMNSRTYCSMSSSAGLVILALGGTAFCMIFWTDTLSFSIPRHWQKREETHG